MKLLVHACCGPCSIMPTRLLRDAGHDIAAFYANSNIAPQEEYAKRLQELVKFAHDEGFSVAEGDYSPALWEERVAPIGESLKEFSPAFGAAFAQDSAHGCTGAGGATNATGAANATGADGCAFTVADVAELLDDERRGERCRACYRLRLEEAAAYAREHKFDGLATTLAVSPYQFGAICEEELARACAREGLEPVWQDFTPHYREATRISRELGMYRQNYCGCRYSVKEAEATRAFIKAKRKAAKKKA